MTTAAAGLGSLLLDLYRLTRGAPSPQFRDSALEAVKRVLPFESALWGTGVSIPDQGARVHSVHLHHQPMKMMEDYESIKHLDWLHLAVMSNPGTTINVTGTRPDEAPEIVEHRTRYRMARCLSTIWAEAPLQVWTAISLYRGPTEPPFEEEERLFKEDLMPHLVEAWHLNAFHFLNLRTRTTQHEGWTRALIDEEGYVHAAEPGFAERLLGEYPTWQGPRVPATLLEVAPGNAWAGDEVLARCQATLSAGLNVLAVRGVGELKRLTARERTVARAFAAGKTHKEIGAELGLSPATIRNQLQSVYDKLGVSTKLELAALVGD